MAIEIIVEAPAQVVLPVEVRGLNKKLLDAFEVVWQTLDDDEADAVTTLRYEVDAYLDKSSTGMFANALAAKHAWSSLRIRIKDAVRQYLVKTDKPGWEAGDIDKVLKHNHYLFALFYALIAVANGAGIEKNALTPDESGQPDTLPAAQAVESPA